MKIYNINVVDINQYYKVETDKYASIKKDNGIK